MSVWWIITSMTTSSRGRGSPQLTVVLPPLLLETRDCSLDTKSSLLEHLHRGFCIAVTLGEDWEDLKLCSYKVTKQHLKYIWNLFEIYFKSMYLKYISNLFEIDFKSIWNVVQHFKSILNLHLTTYSTMVPNPSKMAFFLQWKINAKISNISFFSNLWETNLPSGKIWSCASAMNIFQIFSQIFILFEIFFNTWRGL